MRSFARVASQLSRVNTVASKRCFSMSHQAAFVRPVVSLRTTGAPTIQRNPLQVRHYSAGPPPLTREFVEERIVDLLKCFDKIKEPEKVAPSADFSKDLQLDSLDIVECLFFIEEEFGIEMPDHEADEIRTVGQAIDYILAQPDAF